MTPKRVNRALLDHQGKFTKKELTLHVVGPWKHLPEMAPNGAGIFFFLLIQTLLTFWAEWILILRISILFLDFWIS